MKNGEEKNNARSAGGKTPRSVWRTVKKPVYLLISVAAWLLVWQYAAVKLSQTVLLPRPAEVFRALVELVKWERFGTILRSSLLHIVMGFVAALIAGCVLAVVCRFSDLAAAILIPPMKLVKTVPVVSFIILLLLWVKPARISIVISFLIVLPVVYANVSRGIRETGEDMLEMARVFRIPFLRRLFRLYIPNAVPYANAAVSSGLSLCWKAGIAAEIIGLSADSIGNQLYYSKLYLDTAALFAWTVVVIVVSVLMEWAVMVIFRALAVALTNPTLWYRPGQAARYLLGLPVKEERPAPAEDVEEAPPVISKNAPAAPLSEASPASAESAPEASLAENSPALAEKSPAEPDEPVAVLRGVGKSYDGRAVLADVSFTLRRGEVLLITGASGSGKTTLLRCLTGLVKPDEGTVEYPGGTPRMAAVFQEDRLCEGFSAWKNAALVMPGSARANRERILKELAECGIEESVRKKVGTFSGGMKRRTAWVRALCADPELLVLDEPFTGLDNARQDHLLQRLSETADGCGIVIVTHSASEIAKICESFPRVRRWDFPEANVTEE